MDGHEAARLIESSLEKTIAQKYVTYDFERQMQGATKAKTSEFATRMIENMLGTGFFTSPGEDEGVDKGDFKKFEVAGVASGNW